MTIKNPIALLSLIGFVILLGACAASAPPAVGQWDVFMTTPIGEQEAVLTINDDGTGMFSGSQGDQPIDGIILDGNNVAFAMNISAQGQSISLDFTGTVDGDSIEGEMSTPFGGMALSGTRR